MRARMFARPYPSTIVIPGEQREALRGKGTQGTGRRSPVPWVPFPHIDASRRCSPGMIAWLKGRAVMPLVNVMVNSRAYTIACDEGEEPHLKELAQHVDAKMKELIGTV